MTDVPEARARIPVLAQLRRLPREAWVVFGSAVALGFTWSGLLDAIVSLYVVRMGYGPEFVGASSAAANMGYALAALPGAALATRIGARRGQIVGALGWMAGLLMVSFADLVPVSWQVVYIIVGRVLAAAGMAVGMVCQQPFLVRVTGETDRPLAFALMIALRPVGAALGGMMGGLLPGALVKLGLGDRLTSLTQPRPYGLTLALGALVYLPVIWSLLTLPRDDPGWLAQHQDSDAAVVGVALAGNRGALRGPMPTLVLAAIGLVCALRVGGEFTARVFFSVHADANLGATAAQIGTMVAVSNLLSIPAPLVTPALVRRHGRVSTVAASAMGVALSIGLMTAGGSWATLALGFIGLTVLAAAARAVWSLMIQELVEDGWRPASSAIANLTSGLGTMAASSAGGLLAARVGYPATFAASAALVGLGAVTIALAFRQRVP